MERGEQVLAVDLVGMGDAAPDQPFDLIAEMLAATGERPLGMEAAQLIGVARWAQANGLHRRFDWRAPASAAR